MSGNAALILTIVAIALAIIGGAKFNINTGITGIVFAFLIGATCLNMSLSKVLNAWPYSITFFILLVNLFYGFAVQNGTMKVLAGKLLRLMKGKAALLLPVVALTCAILGVLGAPAPTLVGPIAFSIALQTGISPVAVTMYIAIASTLGSDNPFTGEAGIVSTGLIEKTEYAEHAFDWATRVWGHNCIKGIIILVVVYIIFKCWKGKDVELGADTEQFNEVQKKTIRIIVLVILLIVIPVVLKLLIPGSAFVKKLANLFGTNFCFALGILLMVLCKCGKYEDAMKRVPLRMMVMIGGMNLLMGVAKEAGLVDTISSFLSGNISKPLVCLAIVIIAGFLSFFSGGISVVCPLLYPLVPGLAAATGINPVTLFSCCFVGAMSSSTSPYSRGGATAISTCPDPEVQDSLVTRMLPITLLNWILCAILAALGLFKILAPAGF